MLVVSSFQLSALTLQLDSKVEIVASFSFKVFRQYLLLGQHFGVVAIFETTIGRFQLCDFRVLGCRQIFNPCLQHSFRSTWFEIEEPHYLAFVVADSQSCSECGRV